MSAYTLKRKDKMPFLLKIILAVGVGAGVAQLPLPNPISMIVGGIIGLAIGVFL